MRFAAAVGDLDSPFYEEERQRDVWNEASAVGFQLLLWLGLIGANLMIWIGGSTGLPYALGTIAVVGAAGAVVVGYASRLGVDPESPERLRRPAMVPAVGLGLAFVAGLLTTWEAPSGGLLGGFRSGAVIGGAVGGLVAVVVLVRQVLRGRRSSPEG